MANLTKEGASPASNASLELLYHISRELASDLDLDTVLRRVLRMSLEAVDGNSGSIIVLDQGGNQVTSIIIHSGQVYSETSTQLGEVLERGLAGWVVAQKEPVIIEDTSRDPRWVKRPDDDPEQTGPKAAMSTPLMARDEIVGVMTLVHPTPGTFTEAHGALMQAIADLAGITVLNARLYEESRTKARAMTALAESAMAITASLGTEDILRIVLRQVQEALKIHAVCLSLVDSGQETLSVRAAAGQTSDAISQAHLVLGEGLAGRVVRSGKALVVTNLADFPQVKENTEKYFGVKAQSAVCVPIVAQDEVIGALQAFSPQKGVFGDDAVVVLSGIGGLAGSVIRYGQLFEQLEAAHHRYRDLFDDSIDSILITTMQGKITQFNQQAAAAMQIPPGIEPYPSIFDLHTPEGDLNLERMQELLKEQKIVTYESEIDTTTGHKSVQVFVRKIQLDEGERLQWILHDITEQKRTSALRDELVSTIYHDLRSPLTNVMYSLEMVETMLGEEDDPIRPLLAIAGRAIDRIQRLTASLLDIRTLQAGQPLKDLSDTPVASLLEDAYRALQPIAEAREQRIQINPSEEDLFVFVDADMMRRVLINLLENAVKYTPAKARIEVGACLIDAGVRFWVEDSGPGIPESQRESVFEKYTRLDSSGTGLGLGLAFCKLAVEAHQGKIWLEESADGGARFIILLPLQETHPQEGEPPAEKMKQG